MRVTSTSMLVRGSSTGRPTRLGSLFAPTGASSGFKVFSLQNIFKFQINLHIVISIQNS